MLSKNTKSLESRLKAILMGSGGQKTMSDLGKQFETHFADMMKPTLSDLQSMDAIVKIQYSDDEGDFMVSLIEFDNVSHKSPHETSCALNHNDHQGEGDMEPGAVISTDVTDSLKKDMNGAYTLCFPKNRNYYMRHYTLRQKFHPYHIDSFSITPSYVFIRFYSYEVALNVLREFRTKMEIRPANQRNNKSDKQKKESKTKLIKQNVPPKDRETKADTKKDREATSRVAPNHNMTESSDPDLKCMFNEYRAEAEKKFAHFQQELFAINHRLQDLVVENSKNQLAAQTQLSVHEERISQMSFTIQNLKDALERQSVPNSVDVDK